MFVRLLAATAIGVAALIAPAAATANEPEPVPFPVVEIIACEPTDADCAVPAPLGEPLPINGCATLPFDPSSPAPSVDPGLCPEPLPGCLADENGLILCYDALRPGDETMSCVVSSDGTTNCDDLNPAVDAPVGPPIETISVNGTTHEVGGGYLFIENGHLHASVGCNVIGGAVTIDGDRITVLDGLMSTMMYCEALADAEAALMTVLSGSNLVYAESMTLTSDAGAIALAGLCGDCTSANTEATTNSTQSGLLLGALLLLLPALAGLGALSAGFGTRE